MFDILISELVHLTPNKNTSKFDKLINNLMR
jgi:hypothetical protein